MARNPVSVRLNLNQGLLERAKKMMRGAAGRVHPHRVSVGIHEGESDAPKLDYHGNVTSGDLITAAFCHEFGIGVPERSFIRTWFDQNIVRLKHEATETMRAEYLGNADAAVSRCRQWARELADWIESGTAALAPLSDRTIAERLKAGLKDDPPLFARGQLVKALRGMADGNYST